MTDAATTDGPAPGWQIVDAGGRPLGTVDAVFADYLLVRTHGLLPVDLYVPVTAVSAGDVEGTVVAAAADAGEAYQSWHRPLKAAPHD